MLNAFGNVDNGSSSLKMSYSPKKPARSGPLIFPQRVMILPCGVTEWRRAGSFQSGDSADSMKSSIPSVFRSRIYRFPLLPNRISCPSRDHWFASGNTMFNSASFSPSAIVNSVFTLRISGNRIFS